MQVGVDIIEIKRFEKIAQDEKKMKSIFTENEINYFSLYKNPLEHIAGTFSAKEAVAKAFQTGFNEEITLLNIEILHNGKIPYVNLKGKAKDYFDKCCYKKISLSISHNKTTATAICIIE